MKNFGKEWTVQQDTLLKQLMDLGYSSKKIYENYGEIFGRTENSISQRMCFLRKPIEERVKKEKPKSDNDVIGKLEEYNTRLCNRLDTLTRQFSNLLEIVESQNNKLQEIIESMEQDKITRKKDSDSYIKALYEIKTSLFENTSDTKTMKNFFQKNYKWK